MIIAYDSKTGNVQKFVNKLNMRSIKITEDLILNEKFILITYTTGFGQVPDKVMKFLKNNYHNMVAVAASGNLNWGDNYCKSADIISELYGVPVLYKFELQGTDKDVENFKKRVMEIEVQVH